jgi:S1-C subfamily serine protease
LPLTVQMEFFSAYSTRIAGLAAVLVIVGAVAWNAGFLKPQSHEARESDRQALDAGPISAPDAVLEMRPIQESEQPDLLEATRASLAPEPQRLYLLATSPGPTPSQGIARIGTDTSAPQAYSAGAILLNGARLAEIHNRFVVLERDGERLRLSIGGADEDSDLALVGGEPPAVPPPQLAVDRLSAVIRLSPVYENDLLVGMQVFPGTRSEVFSNLGLRPGDLVVAVEGSPIADASGANEAFQPLLDGVSMNLTLRRESETLSHALDAGIVSRAFDPSTFAAQQPAHPPSG